MQAILDRLDQVITMLAQTRAEVAATIAPPPPQIPAEQPIAPEPAAPKAAKKTKPAAKKKRIR